MPPASPADLAAPVVVPQPAQATGPNGLSPLETVRAQRAAGPVAPPKLQPRRSAVAKSVLHLTRRGHLYAGLLLLPWVFLYGVTGFLFNHPEVWPDNPGTPITATHIAGTSLATLPAAGELAAQVVAAINEGRSETYSLVDPAKIQFGRGGIATVSLTSPDGKPLNLSLQSNGTGIIRAGAGRGPGPAPAVARAPGNPREGEESSPRGGRGRRDSNIAEASTAPASALAALTPEPPRARRRGPRPEGTAAGLARGVESTDGERTVPFAIASGLTLQTSPVDVIRQGLPAVLERAGLSGATIAAVRATPLSFTVEGGGKQWLATYNPEDGSVTGRDVAQPAEVAPLSFRRFLLRMHTAHGYPAEEVNFRWVWAIMVDATALVMVFWGISGLVMWWQIKRTRLLGSVCLLVSTVAATWIGIGMHTAIAAVNR